MTQLAHTSMPRWALPGARRQPDDATMSGDSTGTSYLLVGVGTASLRVLDAWATTLASQAHVEDVRILHADDAAAAGEALVAALTLARVGVRVRLAGPVSACLALRGSAVSTGVEDDELHVEPTGDDGFDVFCAHCRRLTWSPASIHDVTPCAGCRRDLVVYHHVSRRSGHVLGYMVDAEERTEERAEERAGQHEVVA
ncbi:MULTISPECIES: dimethylamine monooxygenase subunit DmmA family protein [Nocardioides]|uniref:Dimethylamine monooxygenase subunit DmmA family protein n=1 Tax=Nocardioides vastitatis TaxID=2568655 RepID=A0ABW0ZFE2_9ACTN|nr:dimethylamine monooxygenase subunit DmmA family protein [Nocardioides sp.]THJ02053.1 hypothetical protein E7Z54_10790 [Nocardioides sp.]